MPCYHPLEGYWAKYPNPNGKRNIVFDVREAKDDEIVKLSCGQCHGCRLSKSAGWAARCMHEASLHDHNSFLTLTYDNDHLPPKGTLRKKDHQDFIKRMRQHFKRKYKQSAPKFKYYHAGEYGENGTKRPHYHTLIFGYDFPDKQFHKNTKLGFPLYASKELSELWPFGWALIGELNFETAAYTARYCMKKVNGDKAELHYANLDDIDEETGEILSSREPEYATMSKGLALDWFKRYFGDVYPHDHVVVNGKEMRPPKYYKDKYVSDFYDFGFRTKEDAQEEVEQIQFNTQQKARKKIIAEMRQSNQTPYQRLRIKEKIAKFKVDKLVRPLGEEDQQGGKL